MEGKRPKQIPIACRFLPYDQWFLTHIDPTLKIKHIKQIILAKCLSLPFDPRKLARETTGDSSGVRPPSPITFAPDESQRPVSPIQFASPREVRKKRSAGVAFGVSLQGDDSEGGSAGGRGAGSAEGGFLADGEADEEGLGGEEGYEEDDEWDDDDDSGGMGAAKRSSIVMGGRVQVLGAASAWSPPPVASTSTSTSTAIPTTSPMKIRKKFNPLAKIAASSFNTGGANASSSSAAHDPAPSSTALVLQQQQQNQIHTGCYTLVRFSTGQILEEDIPASWYDLLPNELVELHASIPPLTFGMSVKLAWNLMNPTSLLAQLAERDKEFLGTMKAKKEKGKSKASNANNDNTDTNTLPYPISASITLVSLPRHDPVAYAQPYWEGWVRALRMVYAGGDNTTTTTTTATSAGPGTAAARMNMPMQEYAMGMTNISGNMAGGMALVATGDGGAPSVGGGGGEVNERGTGKDSNATAVGAGGPMAASASASTSKMESRMEWRERYVVIKDGVVNLFKTRDDPAPTHRLPLTNLMALRDVGDLAQVLNNKTTRSSSIGSGSTAVPTSPSQRHRSSRGASATPADRDKDMERNRKRRSTSLPRSSTSTAKDHRRGGTADTTGGAATLPASHRVGSSSKAGTDVGARGRSHDQHRDHHPSTSRAIAPPMTEEEREARRRLAEKRQKEREEKEKERKLKETHEKEIEYLKRWDDIGIQFSWPKGKNKEKEKEKEKDKGKGKEKENDRGREREVDRGRERERRDETSYKGKERERDTDQPRTRHDPHHDHNRERERQRRRERERERQREKAKRDERTFIPSSKEEAESAGMKIVCAKFRHLRPWEREALERVLAAKDNPSSSGPKYTSTGPSLAGEVNVNVASETESFDGGADRIKHKNVFLEDVNNPYQSAAAGGPPRRPSLPALAGLLGTSASVPSSLNLTTSSAATSSLAVHSVYPASGASGSMGAASGAAVVASGSPSIGPPKFIGGLFGKDKALDVAADKEERKREERERKAREKEQKALEKEKKKARRKEEKETGDEDDGTGTSGTLGWKLRWNPTSSSGRLRERERESMDTLSPPPAISAAPSGSTLLPGRQTDEDQPKEEVTPSYQSKTGTTLNDDQQDDSHLASSLPNLRGESCRPTLTLSPIQDSASPENEQPQTVAKENDHNSNSHQSDSGSSSRSLSSPVFAHSDDENESGDDFDDEFGFGISGYRRDRTGYRYGGYHTRRLEKEKEKTKGTDAPSTSASAAAPADEAAKQQQRVTEVREVEKGKEGDRGSLDTRDVSQTRSTQSQPQRRDPRRRREEERGEWIVLDMGNEHAYGSILRVLHRYFSQPLTSAFVNSSIAGVPSVTTPHPNVTSPNATSNLNSPTQAHFWSSTTLVDDRSMMSDRTKSLRTADSFSSMYAPPPPPSSRQPGQPSTAGSDADDEDVLPKPAAAAAIQAENEAQDQGSISTAAHQTKAEHPPILNTLKGAGKAKQRPTLTPALHYPEWRHEVVQRARRHGLREACRPLDLALYGWSKEFEELGIRERVEVRQKRKEEEERRAKKRASAQEEAVGEEEDADDEEEGGEGSGQEDDDHAPAGFDDEQRRMSAISHVSTLNAMQMNAAAAAAIANRPSASNDQTFLLDEDNEVASTNHPTVDRDDESAEGSEEDNFQQAYSFKYGHEDEEEAIALGMDSFLEDSEEESEKEWVAWVTDLPRQVQVRAEKRKLANEKEKERRRIEKESQLAAAEAEAEPEGRVDPQLSPMVFSDPFTQQQQQSQQPHSRNGSETNLVVKVERSHSESSASYAGSSRSGHSSLPRSQEEERRQVVESRRMMEPTATSTFMPPPAPPSTEPGYGSRPPSSLGTLHPSAHPHTLIHRSSFVRTPAQVLVQSETRVGGESQVVPVPIHHLQYMPSRTLTNNTLSSPSSLESLANPGRVGAAPNVPPISINVSSVGPRSPQLGSFSPESDLTDGSRDAPSSSTTPPSASGHYQPSRLGPKTHSRTPSGADRVVDSSPVSSRMSRLYHSTSMPLAAAVAPGPSGLGVSSGSVPSSPPRSPMRSVSASTSTSANTATPSRAVSHPHPIDKPILTQEQIHQIEAETELMMLNSGRMSSSPPSSYTSHMPVPMQRRSSSAGTPLPVGFSSGSPPSKSMPGSPSESRIGLMNMGAGGSMGRSASVLVKPHPTEGGSERGGRGVLRKRLSDIGKQISGDEKDSPPSSKPKKPKLSLAGLGGGGSSSQSNQHQPDVHSPTYQYQRQAIRSPTISNPSSVHAHGGAGGVVGSGSSSTGTMATAKALLRRVRSGSSLRMDMHAEERESPITSSHPVPNSPTMATYAAGGGSNVVITDNASRGGSWGRETSPEQGKKRKGPVDRLVRGLDSALEFREGR